MKHLLFFLLFFAATNLFSQTVPGEMQVTLTGIGPFKVNMKKTEVEKILGQKITIKQSTSKENYDNDTANVTFKGVELTIVFYQNYTEDKKNETAVFSISSSSPLLKTKSGIGIGDDKIKIITTYNDFDFNFYYNYENIDSENYKRSKINATLMLMGENSPSVLYFNLTDSKVVSFVVSIFEGC